MRVRSVQVPDAVPAEKRPDHGQWTVREDRKIEAIRLVSEGLRFEVIEVDELAGVESYFTKRAEKGDTRPVIVVHES